MTSPWLSTPSTSDRMEGLDPWSETRSSSRSRLGSRSASSSHLALHGSSSREVDRHPLRSPSPNLNHASSQAGLARRRNGSSASPTASNTPSLRATPGGIASEWKAISAGLAGLFSSGSEDARYRWPEDPVSGVQSDQLRSSSSAQKLGDETLKGHQPTALDKLEGWFGLKDERPQKSRLASASQPSLRRTANAAKSSADTQVRVLIHPVAPTDTLSSLALHYGADTQTLRRSNKLWPGDAVQMRSVIYIPIDSCKHRPPNAEIRVLPSSDGAVLASSQQNGPSAALKLAFVPKDDDDDDPAPSVTQMAPRGEPSVSAVAAPAEDPASDFMPDTNKSYTDEGIAGRDLPISRTGSLSRHGGSGYPSSLAPSARSDRRLAAASSVFETAGSSAPLLHRTHSRTGSVGGSTSASASATSSGFVAPRGPIPVSKVPAEKLKFFSPSDKRAEGDDSKRMLGVGPGHPDYQPGESGLDDLLAQRGRDGTAADGPTKPASTASTRPSLLSHVSDFSSTATSDNWDADGDAAWKPNVWKFGEPRSRPSRRSDGARHMESESGAVVFDAGIEAGVASEQAASSRGASRGADLAGYAGWNDAPPPNAIVAKAYDGGAAYKRRQQQKHHRILHDLAAGLPANPGAASKWARPINFGDSLPPASSSTGGSIGRSGGLKVPAPPSTGGKGFGSLLNDAIRGRISVEGALGAALDEVRSKTALDLPHHEGARMARTPSAPPTMPPPPPPPPRAPAAARPQTSGAHVEAGQQQDLKGPLGGTWAGAPPSQASAFGSASGSGSRVMQRSTGRLHGDAYAGKGKDD